MPQVKNIGAKKNVSYLLIFFLLSYFMYALVQNPNFFKNRWILYNCPTSKQGWNWNLYSQSYEDYILSIVFSDVEKGAYVDVGASNPNYNSVTKYFYLKGWQAIHIEPIKKWYDKLVKERPNSVNLNIGISNQEGELEFFHFIDNDVLSTFSTHIASTKNNSKRAQMSYPVPVKTLTQVLKEHPFDQIINFIKIDVEGFENEVLEGMDFVKFRPQILVIEATGPNNFIPSHDQWEHIVLDNGYNFIMFDGVNRYYLAKEYQSSSLNSNFHKAMKCTRAVDENYDAWHGSTQLIFYNDLL